MKLIFIVAGAGLILSAAVHFSTFFGIAPQTIFPEVWLLHILIFVVWVPVVLSLRKSTTKNEGDSWKELVRNSPGWMWGLFTILFVYAIFNLFFTIHVLQEMGSPAIIDGKKVLKARSRIIRPLSDDEYRQHQAYELRGPSGHWMLFYAVGTTILYSKLFQRPRQTFRK